MAYSIGLLKTIIAIWCQLMLASPVIAFRYTRNCGCGSYNDNVERVYMGEEAQPFVYRWLASIEFYDTQLKGNGHCGGSVISNRYVLTAAHCMEPARRNSIKVYPGLHERSCYRKEWYGAEKVIIYPEYQDVQAPGDIALIKLSKKIIFNNIIVPICLPMRENYLFGKNLLFAGWGRTEDARLSNVLIETSLGLLTKENCYQAITYFAGEFVAKWILPFVECAHHWFSTPCEGDSGGPLMDTMKGRKNIMVLRGLLSFGYPCPKNSTIDVRKVNVFVKITEFIEWIDDNTRDSVYCSTGL